MTARATAAAILVGSTAAAPAVFARHTVDGFEAVKAWALLTAVLAVAALAPRRLDPREGAPPRLRRASAIALAYLSAAALTTAFSTSPLTSLLGADESHAGLGTVAATVALFLAARGLGGSSRGRAALLTAVAAGTAVAAAYGAVQALGADPLPWTRVAGLSGWSRPFGTMGHPNHLGGLLAIVLPLQAWTAGAAFVRGRPLAGAVASAGAALSAAVLAATLSRAAWIAAVAGLAVAVTLAAPAVRRLRLLAAGALLLALGIGGLLLPEGAGRGPLRGALAERVRSLATLGPRLPIWQAAGSVFRESPFLGSGLDTFALAFPRHRPPLYWTREYDATPTKAHNDLLHALATQGLVGGLAWLLVAAGGVGLGVAAVRRTTGLERGLAAALLGGWVAFLVHVQASFSVVALASVLVAGAVVLAGLRPAAGRPLTAEDAGAGFWIPTLAAAGAFVLGFSSDGSSLGFGRDGLTVLAVVVLVAASQAWAVHRVTSGLADTGADGWASAVPADAPAARPVAVLRSTVWIAVCAAAWVFLVLRPFGASVAAHRAATASTTGEALALLGTAHRLDPLRVTYLRRLGLALSSAVPEAGPGRTESLERGREALLRAVRLVPADAYGWASLAVCETRLAVAGRLDRDQPFRSLDEALRLDPSNVTFRVAGANAALELGDLERARRYAGEAAGRLPDFAPARAQLAHVAAREGRLEEAIGLLRDALRSEWYGQDDARRVAQANLASLLVRARLYAEAEQVARALLAEAPAFAAGRYPLARALEGLGRTAEAVAEYEATLRLDPAHRGAAEGLRRAGSREAGPTESSR